MLKTILLLSGMYILRFIYGDNEKMKKMSLIAIFISQLCIIWVLGIVLVLCGVAQNDTALSIGYIVLFPASIVIWKVIVTHKHNKNNRSPDMQSVQVIDQKEKMQMSVETVEELKHQSVDKCEICSTDKTQNSKIECNQLGGRKVMHTKNIYCAKCGAIVDSKTKKCSSCGKQYFRISTLFCKIIPFAIAIVLISISVAFNIHQFREYDFRLSELNNDISEKNDTISEKQAEIDSKNEEIATLNDTILELNKKIDDLSPKPATSRDGLKNAGDFESVSALIDAINRDSSHLENMIVSVSAHVACINYEKALGSGTWYYIIDESNYDTPLDSNYSPTTFRKLCDTIFVVNRVTDRLPSQISLYAIKLNFRDEQNYPLSYDRIVLSGIWNGSKLIDVTWEFAE